MAETTLVGATALLSFVERALRSLGVPDDHAQTVAESLVEADLRGVQSHGVIRLPGYAASLRNGAIKAQPTVRVVTETDGQAVMDGYGGMGQVAVDAATRKAMALAQEHGIGAVALRNSNHCGAMAYFAIQGLAHDMLGIATTNAGINMTPTGGKNKLVGNNPIAIAVPTTRSWPMTLDMATSVAAGGKLDVAAAKGEPIPLGWAVDKEGKPTTDAVAGRLGALLPIGGPKGYGLAVMFDVLAGVLSGGRFGAGLGGPGSSQFFLMLRIERFMPVVEFKARMDALIDQLHAWPPVEGSDRVYVPGEIEDALRTKRLRDGIPIEPKVLADLDALAAACGVSAITR